MNLIKRTLSSRTNFIFLLLIVLAILPRFIFLDKVPTSINTDELHYMLDTKSFFLTGRDSLGETSLANVLVFQHPKSEPMQSELTYFLELPFIGAMNFSLLNIVLPNAILSVLTVVLMFLITSRLFNRNVGFISGFVAALNPWLIFSGRTAYEVGSVTFFFLCFFYILLISKGWKILFSLPFALLAFYSYIGTKLIFPLFVLLSIFYVFFYINKRQYFKQYLLLFLASLALSLFFLLQISRAGGSRTAEIITPNNQAITKQVDESRKATLNNPFINLVENKFTVYGSVLVKNTFNIFSPTYLFANADTFFLTGGHGLFYYIDAVFLVLGIIWVFLYRRKLLLFLSSLIFIAILPQILHDPFGNSNFTPHIVLLIPFIIILISLGINSVLEKFKNKKYGNLFIAFIGLIYLFSFLRFSNFYFLKYPLQEGTFSIEERILSKYITLSANEKRPVVVYSVNPKLVFREFLFYSNSYNKNTVGVINNSWKKNELVFDNVSFVSCSRDLLSDSQQALVIDDANCDRERGKNPLSISQLGDSARRYNIYGDRICSKFNLPNYILSLKLSDFSIEKLSEKKFCETFIVSYH